MTRLKLKGLCIAWHIQVIFYSFLYMLVPKFQITQFFFCSHNDGVFWMWPDDKSSAVCTQTSPFLMVGSSNSSLCCSYEHRRAKTSSWVYWLVWTSRKTLPAYIVGHIYNILLMFTHVFWFWTQMKKTFFTESILQTFKITVN